MDGDSGQEEALRLAVLARLQSAPCTVQELVGSLGASERGVGITLSRLVVGGMVEEVTGGANTASPAYRLSNQGQQPRRRRGGGGRTGRPGSGGQHSPVAAHQASVQHGFMPGMLPYHPGHASYGFPQQMLYYPAGMVPAAYQQPPMGPGSSGMQWPPRGPGMQGGGQRSQGPGGGGGGRPVGGLPPMHMGHAGSYPHPMQAFYFPGPGTPMAPLTPAVSASQQRQMHMARAGSGSSTSVSSTGWGGVPLSQSAVEALAGGSMAPSPRSTPQQRSAESRDIDAAAAAAAAAADGAVQAAAQAAVHGAAAPAAAAYAEPVASQVAVPAGQEDVDPDSPSQPATSSGGSEDLSEGTGQIASGGSTSGGEGSAAGNGRGGRSNSGGSSGSRRSRGSRDRQPCAFFLKTGTCAYGDSCKFDHPFDKAPKVEFNSLGLPLRPGEPECAFYLKNFRCAFGHTCKFHHPELPAPAGAAVHVYPMQYHMQYQSPSSSPMLSSVLGLHPKGPGGGSPMAPSMGAMPGSPGMATSPTFYMPFPGFAGRPAGMHPSFQSGPAPPIMGPPPHRNPPHRSSSSSSRAAGGAAAPAVPLPVALPGQQSSDIPRGAGAPEQHGNSAARGPNGGLPGAQASPRPVAVPSGPPYAEHAAPASEAEPAVAAAAAAGVPPPIMVFHRQRQAPDLASAIDQLQLAAEAEEEVGAQAADALRARSGRSSGGGSAGLAHQQPQPQVEMAAA